jgi:hypothetical protein
MQRLTFLWKWDIDTIVEAIVNFGMSNRAFTVLFGPSTPQ